MSAALTAGLAPGWSHYEGASAAQAAGQRQHADRAVGYMEAGAAFIPLRLLAEATGMSINWDGAKGAAVLDKEGYSLTLTIGQKEARLNDAVIRLERAPFEDRGTVYIPLKGIGAALGLETKLGGSGSWMTVRAGGAAFKLPLIAKGALNPDKSPVSVERKLISAAGTTFSVQMVTVSLMDPRVDLEVSAADGGIGSVEELSSIARRHGAILAVNGTFFDAYTDSPIKNPYGYLFNRGKMLYKSSGDKKTVFTYSSNMLAEVLPGAAFEDRYPDGSVDGALQAGPRLVQDGATALNPQREGFRDPKILTSSGARSALGLTTDHKLILLTTGAATINQLAAIMKSAGAWQAMNLDGGASSGLYYNGAYLTRPGRLLSNALLVKLS